MSERKMTKQSWLKAVSSMFQFILGFIVGVTLIASVAGGAAFYYFKRVSGSVPEKPVYTEETAQKSEPSESEETATAVAQPEVAQPQEVAVTEAIAKPEPKPELPEGAYYATVTWPQGLSLRSDPNLNAARIGGISHDARIVILEESSDKKWQKVRIPWSQQEGWVKNGNTKRTSY